MFNVLSSDSGLSIVRHIIELHGGSVSAHSAGRNRGATFTARLPLLRDAEARRHARPLPEAPSMAAAGDQVAMLPARRAGDRATPAPEISMAAARARSTP